MSFHSYESRIDDDTELLSETLEEVLRSSGDPADQKYRVKSESRTGVRRGEKSRQPRFGQLLLSREKAVCRADDYVHDKPWRGIGVGATVGLVMGLLLARR